MIATIQVAAKWWTDRLRSAVGLGNVGEWNVNNVMAVGMIGMIRDRHPPTEDNAKRFEAELLDRLAIGFVLAEEHEQKYEAWRNTPGATGAAPKPPDIGCHWFFDDSGWNAGGVDLSLKVDYHPEPMLHGALLVAGIDRNVADVAALPTKTTMRVSKRRVVVSAGYGAPWVEIACLWGASRVDQEAATRTHEASEEAYEAWRATGRRGPHPESFNVHRETRR